MAGPSPTVCSTVPDGPDNIGSRRTGVRGYVLTNIHVISLAGGGGDISVLFSACHSAPATITGRDPKADLAVVRVDEHPSSNTVTSGIISVRDRSFGP